MKTLAHSRELGNSLQEDHLLNKILYSCYRTPSWTLQHLTSLPFHGPLPLDFFTLLPQTVCPLLNDLFTLPNICANYRELYNSPSSKLTLSSRWKVGKFCVIVSLSSQVASPSSNLAHLMSHSSLAHSLFHPLPITASRVRYNSNSLERSGGISWTILLSPTTFLSWEGMTKS